MLYGQTEQLQQLEQHDLVQVILHADQLAVQAAAVSSVALLRSAAARTQGLTQACFEALAALPAWPSCMIPLLKQLAELYVSKQQRPSKQQLGSMLVTVLGDLEEVWRDKKLQQLLLWLPLPAVELLLSSDQLQVVSEDTVLYTALRYVMQLGVGGQQAAKEALSACIRCPQLSLQQLLMQAASTDKKSFTSLFDDLQPKRLQLAVMYAGCSSSTSCKNGLFTQFKDWMPASWLLGPRTRLVPPPAGGVSVTYKLPVEELRAACRRCSKHEEKQMLYSDYSPPINGFAWRMFVKVYCATGAAGEGVRVGVLRPPSCAIAGWAHSWSGTIHKNRCNVMLHPSVTASGFSDFFGVGVMAGEGGWDKAAWAAKGLPTAGDLELVLPVQQEAAGDH